MPEFGSGVDCPKFEKYEKSLAVKQPAVLSVVLVVEVVSLLSDVSLVEEPLEGTSANVLLLYTNECTTRLPPSFWMMVRAYFFCAPLSVYR